MPKITENFWRSEFACKCKCGFDAVDIEVVQRLEITRAYFGGWPLTINSGCRCWQRNATERGSLRSYHMRAIAVDFWIETVYPDAVADYLETIYPNSCGLGRYNTFTHLDMRPRKARWDKRN